MLIIVLLMKNVVNVVVCGVIRFCFLFRCGSEFECGCFVVEYDYVCVVE